jgi:hypothetical protein
VLKIKDTLVSLDLIEQFFACDLPKCNGQCCIEGDAGAPVEPHEISLLKDALPAVWNDLSPDAQAIIKAQGVTYIDSEMDTVTSIVNGKDCVFAFHDGSICKCTIEKAFIEGRTAFRKPVSCRLYPVRVTNYEQYQAVNYDRWNICRHAESAGKRANIRLFRYLKEPLSDKFGQDWFDELELCANEWLSQFPSTD